MSEVKIILISLIMIVMLFVLTGCSYNKQIIDLTYSYDKCKMWVGNEVIEVEIKSWNDYEGEQLQIIDKDGKVYLVSSMNAILIKEK